MAAWGRNRRSWRALRSILRRWGLFARFLSFRRGVRGVFDREVESGENYL